MHTLYIQCAQILNTAFQEAIISLSLHILKNKGWGMHGSIKKKKTEMIVNSKGLSANFSICPLHRMTDVQPIPHCSPIKLQQLPSYYFNSYNDPVFECI
jgi:hypothetical protein